MPVQYGPAFQTVKGSQEVKHYTPFIFHPFKEKNKKLFYLAYQSNVSYLWVALAIINHVSDCKTLLLHKRWFHSDVS